MNEPIEKATPGIDLGEVLPSEAIVKRDGSFRFFAPMYAFEKADAPEGKKRRIGGVISTDTKDREHETILQDGLDFSPFMKDGYFNDNHMKGIAGIIGEPDPSALKFFKRGDRLPTGQVAKSNGHWAEGWLYEDDPRATEIWHKARAMQKSPTGRRLGFSIEGAILKRVGSDNKTIAKARVLHVAATHCPVNPDTTLDVLAKSLSVACAECASGIDSDAHDIAEHQAREALGAAAAAADQVHIDGITDMDLGNRPGAIGAAAKALSMGAPSTSRPSGLVSGAGAGRTLAPQSLEHDARLHGVVQKSTMSVEQAITCVRARFPNISCATAGRIVDLTLAEKRRGRGGQHG